MFDEIMTEELKDLFLEDLFKDNFTYPNHRFSFRYRYRKKRLLKQLSKGIQKSHSKTSELQPTHVRIPMKYILLIVILLVLAILGFTIYRNYSGLMVKEQDDFSSMFADCDPNAPKVLTEKFYIDMDLSDYEEEVVADDDTCRWIVYKSNGKKQFYIVQTTTDEVSSRLNTEDAVVMSKNVVIDNWNGLYYHTNDGWHFYIFNLGDYVIFYSGIIYKDDIEKLVKATKFV